MIRVMTSPQGGLGAHRLRGRQRFIVVRAGSSSTFWSSNMDGLLRVRFRGAEQHAAEVRPHVLLAPMTAGPGT
jgi:hypothetical protein